MSNPPRRTTSTRIAVLLLALLPAGLTLGAGWIAEDTAIAAYVHDSPWWRDWLGPQYGVRVVSTFWRPLVSTSWGIQVELAGLAPPALRSLNLLAHGACAVLMHMLLTRLSVRPVGAFLGALAVGCFPEQGGTVTWIAGRTDVLVALGILATVLVSLSRRWPLAAIVALFACATKEFAFLLPAWCLLAAAAAGLPRPELVRRVGAVAVGCFLAYAIRFFAIGTWGGGAPAVLPGPLDGALGVARALGTSWHASALGLVPLAALAAWSGALSPRLSTCAVGIFLLGVVPLYPLLADGLLEEQNARLYFVPDLGLGLLLGALLARPVTRPRAWPLLLALAGGLVGWRGVAAARDAAEWSAAAATATREEARARSVVSGTPSSRLPVWVGGFPRTHGGAYCMGFGVADRFRPPFEATPRPVWPWRSVSSFPSSERAPRAPLRSDGSLWPDQDRVPAPVVSVDVEGALALALDERVLQPDPDIAPKLHVAGSFPGDTFELLVLTPSGYEPFPLGPVPPGDDHSLSVRALFEASNGIFGVGSLLEYAADLGALRSFLELRVLAPDGSLRAVSPLVELTWDRAFLAATRGE